MDAPAYNITPQDYQYLRAMLNHEAGSTITHDLSAGNTNSAYGQLAGLTETWLNRAMSRGTGIQQQMLAPGQLSFFSAANVPNEASTLDPRIGSMLDAYLQSRSSGDAGVLGNVNQYLNRDVTDALYSQGYRGWYDQSSLLGAFGDPRSGGRSSLQQEFLSNPSWGSVPDYGVSLDPSIRLNLNEGDVDALAQFRNGFRPNTPLPPSRPTDGTAGIVPRGADQGFLGSLPDQFSDAITGGLDAAGNAILGTFNEATGRLPSASEFSARIDALKSGASNLYDQLGDITRSPEAQGFAQQTGIDPSRYAIDDIYRLGLGQGASDSDITSGLSILQSGGSLGGIASGIANSTAGQTYQLDNFYQNAFGRSVDSPGLQYGLDQLAHGASLQSLETQLLQSPEAQTRGITQDQVASFLTPNYYAPTLGSGGGISGFLDTSTPVGTQTGFDPSGGVGAGAAGFGIDPVINTLYRNTLGRDADASGSRSYAAALQAGTLDLNGIQQGLLASPEGQARLQNTAIDVPTYGATDSDYARVLDRFADAPGRSYFDAQVEAGTPRDQIVAALARSPEAAQYAQTLGIDPSAYAATFGAGPAVGTQPGGGISGTLNTATPVSPIDQIYQATLHRAADAPGLDYYDAQLRAGTMDLNAIQAALQASPEAQTLGAPSASRTYSTADTVYARDLGRLADPVGQQGFDAQIAAGSGLNAIEAGILASPEAQARGAPPAVTAWSPIQDIYARDTGRLGEAAGVDGWTRQLAAGQSLPQIEAAIRAAPEAQGYLQQHPTEAATYSPLDTLYARDLGRAPDAWALQNYQNVGAQGFGGIEAQVYGSPESSAYRSTLSPDMAALIQAPAATPTQGGGGISGTLNTGSEVGTQGPGAATAAWSGHFDPNAYRAANADVAASGMDALTHYLTYGYNEGRALDTAGDRVTQGFDPSAYLQANPDVAAAHVDPLRHYLENGASEGRSLPTGSNPYSFSGASVGQGAGATGSASFGGRFDPGAYLGANPDVAASGMDALTHYQTYGFNEGRAIDGAGDRINRAFDPTAYLAQNQDVAAAHVDPLAHYLNYGAAEGRALPTGSNPYQFSAFNAAQGLGPTGNGGFGLGGITSSGGSPAAPAGGGAPSFGAGLDVSGGVQNGAFGIGGITSGGTSGATPITPYGFSGANVGGGLGATPQSFGSLYPAGGATQAPSTGGGIGDPYGFSTLNAGGFDANAKGDPGGEDFGGGSGMGPVSFGSDPVGELAYLNTQQNQINQQVAAGRDPVLNNPNLYNVNLGNLGNGIQSHTPPVTAAPVPFATNNANMAGALGYVPYTPPPLINTIPTNFGTFGGTFF